jgi:hypothetical protein
VEESTRVIVRSERVASTEHPTYLVDAARHF